MPERELILASASPRRREMLTKYGYAFRAVAPEADEHAAGDPARRVRVLSKRKARVVAKTETHGLIVASDTLVALNGEALGKPADADDAMRMLRALSGKAHDVFTGLCLLDAESGRTRTHVEKTRVVFRELTDAEIEAYVATGEPLDKAGAYAIQGGAAKFVISCEGSYENVIGFPIQAFAKMLAEGI